ncbi:MAG: response regulator [Caulobacteraceae bacterium]|nr:response regulator [Caulobacteraceae bacterium]
MQPASGYALVAQVRARELRTRIGLGIFLALSAFAVAPSIWPGVWFATMCASQALDWLVFRPFRLNPQLQPSLAYRCLCLATSFCITLLYSATSAYFWFEGGLAGKLFAMLQVCGGLLHVSLHMHHARPLLLATVLPHASYLFGLPMLAAFNGEPGMGVMVVGGLLYCAHLAAAVKQTRATQDELRAAHAEADAERARAERASAAKSDFLATVSHEIRTPMNAVISGAELLRRTNLTSEQADHVGMLLDAGDVLMGVLNDVLDISKIEAGKMTLEAADLDLPAKLHGLVRLWEPRARDKGVAMTLHAAAGLPERARTDPLRLQQILFNLLSNAVKFTDAGSIALSAGRDGQRLWFEVRDTGCGMAPEIIERLFASFEQADAGTTRRYGGTGLGLTISRRLAELMGGDLTVSSTPGEGSTFRLELPFVAAAASADSGAGVGEAETAPASAAALKVLVAEDHEVNRRIVSLFLQPLGCTLTMVENGREALDLASVEAFDVILMDMQMPVMDGLDAARAIRQGGGPNAHAPIIALTANALDHHRTAWAGAGVETFLTKPVDPRALTAAVLAAGSARARLPDPETAAA